MKLYLKSLVDKVLGMPIALFNSWNMTKSKDCITVQEWIDSDIEAFRHVNNNYNESLNVEFDKEVIDYIKSKEYGQK